MDIAELEIEAFGLTDPAFRHLRMEIATLPDGSEGITAHSESINETQLIKALNFRCAGASARSISIAVKTALNFSELTQNYGFCDETKGSSLHHETIQAYLKSKLPGHSEKLYVLAATRITKLYGI